MKLIVIVPFDLARSSGWIVVGPETKIACNRALELALNDSTYPVVVCTAGIAGAKWDNAWMARVIEEYVQTCFKHVLFLAGKAETFNTSGEMKALAQIVRKHHHKEHLDIVLCVKWWHAPRTKFLCHYWLRKCGVRKNVSVSVSSCRTGVGWKTIALEYLVAWPKNLLKILLKRN